jgi:hypothetical protein
MPWWGWALIGWAALAAAAGVLIGRSIRTADRREQNAATTDGILAEADRRASELWPMRPLRHDGPPYPRLSGRVDPSLAGAILTLAYCTDETAARVWLAECARRGADWNLQQQLWDGWQAEHARDVTTLHTDPEEPTP